MTAEELILELRDLQPPAEPGWWLLAPAWNLILVLFLGLLLLAWLVFRYRDQNRLLNEARQEIQSIRHEHESNPDRQKTLQALSAWLKRVAMAAYPGCQVAALTGDAWIEFLNQCSRSPHFGPELARAFGNDIYRSKSDTDVYLALDSCESWLNAIGDRLRKRGKPRASV